MRGLGGRGGSSPALSWTLGSPENQIQRLSRLGLGGSTCQHWQEVGQVWHPGSKLGARERLDFLGPDKDTARRPSLPSTQTIFAGVCRQPLGSNPTSSSSAEPAHRECSLQKGSTVSTSYLILPSQELDREEMIFPVGQSGKLRPKAGEPG